MKKILCLLAVLACLSAPVLEARASSQTPSSTPLTATVACALGAVAGTIIWGFFRAPEIGFVVGCSLSAAFALKSNDAAAQEPSEADLRDLEK